MRNCSPACHYPDGVLNSNWRPTTCLGGKLRQLGLTHDGEWIHSFGWTAPLASKKVTPTGWNLCMQIGSDVFYYRLCLRGESCPMVWGQRSCLGYLCNEGNLTNKVILVNCCSVGLLISIDPMSWVACPGVWAGGCWGCGPVMLPTVPWSCPPTRWNLFQTRTSSILI